MANGVEISGPSLASEELHPQLLAEAALRSISLATRHVRGENFYQELVRELALALGVHYVIAGRVVSEAGGEAIQTLAVWAGSGYMPNIRYSLLNTPCRNVADQTLCFHPMGVQEEYPLDVLLVEMGAESYIGMPMVGTDGSTLGILVALDTKPMPERTRLQALSLLSIFATRCAAELQHEAREAELERLVAARGEQLAAARAALIQQEAAASLGQLAAALNHQLNTPLGTALTLVSTVEEKSHELATELQGAKVSRQRLLGLAQTVGESARMMQESLQRAIAMVERTRGLDLSTAPRLTQALDVRLRVQDLLQAHAAALDRAQAAVHLDAPAAVMLWQPSQWLDIVLQNLLSNALQHALVEPCCNLNIGVHRAADGGLDLHWADDGPGVPKDQRQRLFEPYSPGRLSGGQAGLGLHIVRLLSTRMGGHVQVLDSARGLHLHVHLPVGSPP